MSDPRHELLRVEFLKATPALAGAAFTLNHLVACATLIYVVLQASYLVWKWRREIRAAREASATSAAKAVGS